MNRRIMCDRVKKILESECYLRYKKEQLPDFYASLEEELLNLAEYDEKFAITLTSLYKKYDEFYNSLVDKKYNDKYELAEKLQAVVKDEFDLTSLDAVQFKILKDYYEKEYRYYISFYPNTVSKLDNIISTLSKTLKYQNAVNFTSNHDTIEYIEEALRTGNKLPEENISYIEKYAIKINDSQVKSAIYKLYNELYKVGTSMNLDECQFNQELFKLYNFITCGKFEKEFGRKYDVIDMYLTTNLQIVDLINISGKNYDIEKIKVIKAWLAKQYSLISNISGNKTSKNARLNLINFPACYHIKHLKQMDFKFYSPNKYSIEDVEEAEKILLDLNNNYGVKYDVLSLARLVDSYKQENDLSYYSVAGKYFEEVAACSYVDNRSCNPTFVRRYKKIENK